MAADLARARTQQAGNVIIQNLQSLMTRGYNQIYQGSRRQEWQAVIECYRWGLPAIVQQTWGYIAIATGIFIIGCDRSLVVCMARSHIYGTNDSGRIDEKGAR